MLVSVIIPTYKRPDSVNRLLDSLARQSLAFDKYEVVVVDDGSAYNVDEVTGRRYPFALRYKRQQNQGATIARNNGVRSSRGKVLVFIDDDVTVSPEALAALAGACMQHEKVVAMGTLISRFDKPQSAFTKDALRLANRGIPANGRLTDRFVHFSHCNTQLLAVRRDDFMALNMLQDPTGGWPNWDDVDFGYRAYLAGFKLLQVGQAVGEHWDYSLADLGTACHRWQRACKSAVRLFQVHPSLQPHIPMLYDKTPIVWGQDGPVLIGRKVVRRLMSADRSLRMMERAVALLERTRPESGLLPPLYRWIQGGYMYRGYQEGLGEETAVVIADASNSIKESA